MAYHASNNQLPGVQGINPETAIAVKHVRGKRRLRGILEKAIREHGRKGGNIMYEKKIRGIAQSIFETVAGEE